MHTPDNPRNLADDVIDARLAVRPVRPASDFAESVFARIEADAMSPERVVDDALAARPLGVTPDFTSRVMAAVAAERRRRRFTLWGAPMAAAACVALALAVGLRPADNADTRLARLLAEDAELKALCAYSPVTRESQLEGDLAALLELGTAETLNEPNESVS